MRLSSSPETSHFTRMKQWVKTHRTRTILGVSILLIILVSGAAYALLSHPVEKIQIQSSKPAVKKAEPIYSPLTGLAVKKEEDRTKPVTALMIENSPDARPQSGLKQGEIIYEAIAEGGITRFLVLYQQNKPQLIGPVRSVRPYYIDWSVPYNASIGHSGGSAQAIQELRSGTHRDIGQPTNGNSYWRSTDRYAPHNVYTSFEQLDALNASKGYTSSQPKEFERQDGKPIKTTDASSIQVTISSPLFNSSYTYDASTNTYARAQGGAPHTDREEGQISPSVVVVMNVEESTVFQDTNRQVIQTTGSGEVTIFQNGTAHKGTWNRASRDDAYTFKDGEGNPILLNRGQTWITAIPNGVGAVSWQ